MESALGVEVREGGEERAEETHRGVDVGHSDRLAYGVHAERGHLVRVRVTGLGLGLGLGFGFGFGWVRVVHAGRGHPQVDDAQP